MRHDRAPAEGDDLLTPGEITDRRRRLPAHARAALDEAYQLAEEIHQVILAIERERPTGEALTLRLLQIAARNARLQVLVGRALLGRRRTGGEDLASPGSPPDPD